MPESLIEQLPKIVAEGKKEVERILERLSGPNKLTLQTNESVGRVEEAKPDNTNNRLIIVLNYHT